MKPHVIITLPLLLGTLGWAAPKPTTKDFAAPCSTVWEAAKAVVPKHYEVLNLTDQSQSGSFNIGNGVITARRALSFSLSGAGDVCTVSVTGHFSGLANNDKGDFFKRIQAELAAKPAPQAAVTK
jgi:hypothetical protein